MQGPGRTPQSAFINKLEYAELELPNNINVKKKVGFQSVIVYEAR
jgi:hypothetical protein